MDQSKWRTPASTVWCVDAVLLACECLILTFVIVGVVIMGPPNFKAILQQTIPDDPDTGPNIHPLTRYDNAYFVKAMWFFLGLWVGLCCIRVVASWKLAVATRPACEGKVAVRNAFFWVYVKATFLLLYFVGLLWEVISGTDKLEADLGVIGLIIAYIVGIGVVLVYRNDVSKMMAAQHAGNRNVMETFCV